MEIFNGIHTHSYQRYLLDLFAHQTAAKEQFFRLGPLFAFPNYVAHCRSQALAQKSDLRLILLECKIENIHVFSDQWSHPTADLRHIGILKAILSAANTVILLRRTNVLERFCSDLAAGLTGVYHSDQGKQNAAIPRQRVNVSDAIAKFSEEIEYDNKLFAYLASEKKGDTHLFEYERIYDGNRFSTQFVERFLRIFGITPQQPTLERVRAVSARDMIENFSELQAAMNNCPLLSGMATDT